jgi:beta-lactamase class A
MAMTSHLDALDADLDRLPGRFSVWCAPIGAADPWYSRLPDDTHYAASTMKAAILAALYRGVDAGRLDLDREVPVANDFVSSHPDRHRFAIEHGEDQDDEVWARVGATAPLGWLARHMIVRSSNLATNVVLGQVGVPAVTEVLRLVGAERMRVERGIEDYAARDAGIDNLVTARDLASLLGAIALGADSTVTPGDGRPLASARACQGMLDVLCAQEHREDLAAGLPDGTRIAHKNGWINGVRHGAGVVFPDDAPPYTVVVCASTPLADPRINPPGPDGTDPACEVLARISAAAWADRHA